MIHDPPALTIHRGFKRPSAELINKFRGAQTSHLADDELEALEIFLLSLE